MVNEATQATAGRAASSGSSRRRRSGRREKQATLLVIALTVASAVAGALAGCHPTGTPVVDAVYSAALAGLVTFAASRTSRSVLIVVTAIGVIFSRSWLFIPALAALGAAFATTFQRRSHRRISAVIGAVAIQVILRWPSIGFQGLTAAIAAVAIALVLVSAWKHSRSRTRRRSLLAAGGLIGLGVVLSIPVVISALSARHPVETGVSLARGALNQVESGRAPAATAKLHAAATDLTHAHSTISSWWNAGSYLVPGVAQQERSLSAATAAGARLTSVAAADGPKLDLQALRYHGGRIDLTALQAMAGPVNSLDAAISSAQQQLKGARSAWVVPPIADRLRSLSAQVDKAGKSVSLAALGIKDLPPILGADGVRHYLVAFMTPAETRGLGGFIGAYGLLTVDHGSIKLTSSGQATALAPAAPKPVHLTGPADYLARYGRFHPQHNFEDVTYSPDFPSVEQVLAGLYPQVTGVHVDGVMMLDPYAMAAMLNFTGPISIPGLASQLTAANAANVLLRTQYLTGDVSTAQRHDLLQGALAAGFHRLTSGSLPSPKTMSAVLDPLARQGRLMFWSSHPSDQPLLDRLGITGAFPSRHGGDLLAVTVANAGNNKVDAYVHQSTSDQVQYDPSTGQVTARVTISLHNDAPSSGMPDYVIGSFDDKSIPLGTSYTWLTLYSPLQIQQATENGGDAGFSKPVLENGVNAYSTYVDVYSKSTTTITVLLKGHVKPGSDYHLTTRLQPLANPQSFTVDAQPTNGWYADPNADTTWTAGPDEVQTHSWAFRH